MTRCVVYAALVLGLGLAACSDDDDRGRRGPVDTPVDGALRDAGRGDGAIGTGSLDGAASAPGAEGGSGSPGTDLDASRAAGDAQALPSRGDAASPFPVNSQGQVLCGTAPCACSDGIDNDMDGRGDLADVECVSAWDNDEASFGTGISGDNRDPFCQDCFFDGNSGSGNDGCRIATSCLTNQGDPSSGRGSCNTCEANDRCRRSCQAYTPNGCDCFGCCEVQLGTNVPPATVLLSSRCSIDNGVVAGTCQTCQRSTTCGNTCGRCELCPGKTAQDLPADCAAPTPGGTGDGGVSTGGGDAGTPTGNPGGTTDAGAPVPPLPVHSCDEGQARCGEGLPACPSIASCTFGCCIPNPIFI